MCCLTSQWNTTWTNNQGSKWLVSILCVQPFVRVCFFSFFLNHGFICRTWQFTLESPDITSVSFILFFYFFTLAHVYLLHDCPNSFRSSSAENSKRAALSQHVVCFWLDNLVILKSNENVKGKNCTSYCTVSELLLVLKVDCTSEEVCVSLWGGVRWGEMCFVVWRPLSVIIIMILTSHHQWVGKAVLPILMDNDKRRLCRLKES